MEQALLPELDIQGHRVAVRGSVVRRQKGLLGNWVWKRVWAYCDERRLIVWGKDLSRGASAADLESQAPTCVFIVAESVFSESHERLYAFSADDGKVQVMLAVDDARTYEVWHELFSRASIRGKLQQSKAEKDAEVQRQKLEERRKVELKTRDDDIIADFFLKRDIAGNVRSPIISAPNVHKLLLALDPQTPPNTGKLACLEMCIDPKSGSMTKSEFLSWWKVFCAQELGGQHLRRASAASGAGGGGGAESGPGDASSPEVDFGPVSSHYATFLDYDLVNLHATRRDVLDVLVPPAPPASANRKVQETVAHPEINEGDNWNDVYQRLVSSASRQFVFEPLPKPPAPLLKTMQQQQQQLRNGGKPAAGNDAEFDDDADADFFTMRPVTGDEAVASCRTLAVFEGEFIKEALIGAKLLVDEFLLPLHEKTPGVISLSSPTTTGLGPESIDDAAAATSEEDDVDAAALRAADKPVEEVFGYGGLLFRIAAVAADEQDQAPSVERSRFIAGADELFHKIAGNEHRHGQCIQQAVRAVHADHCASALKQAVNEALPASVAAAAVAAATGAATAESSPEPVYPKAFLQDLEHGEQLSHPRTLLSAVVDYSGFRITVLCPTDLDERTSLVHGAVSQVHIDEHGQAFEDDVFVDAYPESVGPLLGRVAAKLHLSTEKRVALVVASAADVFDDHGNAPAPREIEVLARDFQVHECTGAWAPHALYLVNLRHLLPSDLPRSQTNDLLTRSLRPEFVRSVAPNVLGAGPLSGTALASVSQDVVTGDGEGQFGADLEGFWEEFSSPPATLHLTTCSQLYTQLLPALAQELDELTCLPLDSFSLSRCFHAHGASMRHLGVVHALSRMPFVQSLLLSEAVARSCKTLLAKALRDVLREGRAAAMTAEARGLSQRKDFVEFNRDVMHKRRGVVLDLFNAVLGSGPASTVFWRDVLPDVLFQKFGIELDARVAESDKRHKLCHLPQLSLALQYHTGTLLRDGLDFTYASVEEAPIKDDDLVSLLLPSVKLPSTMPGRLGESLERAEALMGAKLFADAAALLRLRLQLQLLSLPDSSLPRHSAAVADTMFKAALCYWEEGDYVAVVEVLSRALASRPRYTAASARMLTLLMSAQLMSGAADAAMATYEEGASVYVYVLGEGHPAVCVHLTALADCYCALGRPKQAQLMLTMAHELGRTLLGDAHLLIALYGAKIAALSLMHSGGGAGTGPSAVQAKLAKSALSDALRCFEAAVARGAGKLEAELADCLLALSACPGQALEEAAVFAGRAAEIMHASYHPLTAASFERPQVVSAVFLLAEAKLRRKDVEGCLALYERAWQAVRTRPSDYPAIGTTFALLSCRLLGTLFASLALQTRSLLETVAKEVSRGHHGDGWDQACRTVLTTLWEGGARSYFQAVVDGLIQAEIEAGGMAEEKASAPGLGGVVGVGARGGVGARAPVTLGAAGTGALTGTTTGIGAAKQSRLTSNLSTRALEIAVIVRLVEYNHASQSLGQ